MRRDTRTAREGIYARHEAACTLSDPALSGAMLAADVWPELCDCTPRFWGRITIDGRTVRTPLAASQREAARLRADLLAARRPQPGRRTGTTLREARERFLADALAGRALNKHGRPFKPSAARDIESALRNHAGHLDDRDLGRITHADLQAIASGWRGSGSRCRAVINGWRSLWSWARGAGLIGDAPDPSAGVRLPAMDSTPRDRVEPPEVVAAMLDVLPLADRVPYALAAYTGARRNEIRHLRWGDLDLMARTVILCVDEAARKSEAGWRIVPIPQPLHSILADWLDHLAAMRADGPTRLVCPGIRVGGRSSGMLSFEALAARAAADWQSAGFEPIAPHELRHTYATWLDAAGISERVASRLMGHSVARPGDGAAVTRRYQHLLPDDLQEARRLLDAYLTPPMRIAPTPVHPAGHHRPRLRLVV